MGLALLLVGTAAAYLWNLTANGWGNTFYAAAVQAGSKSWKALFFGSSDWPNTITVDKTPASLWPMELSARIFGFGSWSILMPQVLFGLASVALLWACVRRYFGPVAGLGAGLVLALTPVAALMFRFNNPDALLVLLMIAAVWAMLRAVEDGRWRWLVWCGLFVGFGFLAKQLQVLLVVPALALTYLVAGPPKLGKRIAQLFAAGVAMIVGAGWWVLVAQLWPADSRPYFGGSQHNSIVELTLGYNGLDRLGSFGSNGSSSGPGGWPDMPGGFSPWGHAGITRLFTASVGGQIAWLIPAALVLLVVSIVLCGKAARTDRRRAALLLFGVWGLVTGLVFSFMSGIFHEYYTVALAPAVAAVVGAGSAVLWRDRDRLWVRSALAVSIVLTAVTAWILLARMPDFVPWLRWVIAGGAVVAVLGVLVQTSRLAYAAVCAVLFVGLAAPTAYAVDTLQSAHGGSIPKAGPQTGLPWMPGGGGMPPGNEIPPFGELDAESGTEAGGGAPGGGPGVKPPGEATEPSSRLVALLTANARSYTWVAATVGSTAAADYQLATDGAVMPIGGFSGGDPAPTLAQFQNYVSQGRIHYYLASAFANGAPGSSTTTEGTKITQWVRDHYRAVEVDGVTVFDLTAE
ncbi:glycosyltransferase family 39 protein [Nocardia sp. CA-135398]|uniref:glycosyltransferase family 39 protein n=1 Tax=Nocardia sp. CA-135398 TaxID=3239977 RepID=UPI003D962869